MINLKIKEEIQIMSQGGRILAEVINQLLEKVKPGVSELEIDQLAEELIVKKGAEPGFKKVRGYNHTICACTNSVVVHGIPSGYKLKEGDVFGVDCGVYYKGFYTDAARTLRVRDQKAQGKSQNDEIDVFLETGKRALGKAIESAKIGNRIEDISEVIQNIIENAGYSVVRSLVGHGVGRELHEDPEIPGFIQESYKKTPLIKEGMTLAIEVIYNMGKSEVERKKGDEWTIFTSDGSLSATFEKTIAVTQKGPLILTAW